MRKKVYAAIFGSAAFAALAFAGMAGAQTMNGCQVGFSSSVAVPSGYGAAFDPATGTQLINCSDSANGVTLNIGSGSQTQYVYKLGYAYQGGTWQPLNLTSQSALASNNWYLGSATAALPFSATELTGGWNYVVAYVCSWNGSAWKCGCADSACTTSHWQMQSLKRQAPATTLTATPTTGAAPLVVGFNANTAGGTISFGDGATGAMNPAPVCASCAAVSTASHTYSAAGTYTAILSNTCPSTQPQCPVAALASVAVTVTAPATTLTATPTSGAAPLAVGFNANTAGGTINFGDGTTGVMNPAPVCASCAAASTASHTYSAAGTYTAILSNTCPSTQPQCPNAALATVTVTVSAAGATLTATPASGSAPLTVGFNANTAGGTIIFGDGATGTMNPAPTCAGCTPVSTASHTYTAAGTYTANLSSVCPATQSQCPLAIIAHTTVTVQ